VDLRDAETVSGFWIASYPSLALPGQAEAMTNTARIMIAAGVTALFLAGICAAGLVVRGGQPKAATTADAPSAPEPAAASGADGDVSAVLDAALAAASGKDSDVAAVLDAALAAAAGKDGDVSAVLDAVLAKVTAEDHGDDGGGSAPDEKREDDE